VTARAPSRISPDEENRGRGPRGQPRASRSHLSFPPSKEKSVTTRFDPKSGGDRDRTSRGRADGKPFGEEDGEVAARARRGLAGDRTRGCGRRAAPGRGRERRPSPARGGSATVTVEPLAGPDRETPARRRGWIFFSQPAAPAMRSSPPRPARRRRDWPRTRERPVARVQQRDPRRTRRPPKRSRARAGGAPAVNAASRATPPWSAFEKVPVRLEERRRGHGCAPVLTAGRTKIQSRRSPPRAKNVAFGIRDSRPPPGEEMSNSASSKRVGVPAEGSDRQRRPRHAAAAALDGSRTVAISKDSRAAFERWPCPEPSEGGRASARD
jgi:hypothetical protein